MAQSTAGGHASRGVTYRTSRASCDSLARCGWGVLAALLVVLGLFPAGGAQAAAADGSRVTVFVKLDSPGLAAYRGDRPGLRATSPAVTGRPFAIEGERAKRYLRHVRAEHNRFLVAATRAVPGAQLLYRHELVVGGVTLSVPRSQLQTLQMLDGAVAVEEDRRYEPQTDRSAEIVGAPAAWGSEPSLRGDGVVVGVLDTGIWPEHPSFADEGSYPAPPDPPAGVRRCEFGGTTSGDAAFECNNKLIGAYKFLDASDSLPPGEFDSARDSDGHGTHVAATAVGNSDVAAVVAGRQIALTGGVAPRAHLVTYRVCTSNSCAGSDTVAAIEQALRDGVDVLNFSVGGGWEPYRDPVSLAFLDAYEAGVVTTAAAGNLTGDGTAFHLGPWMTTVGATVNDRTFVSDLHFKHGADQFDVQAQSLTSGFPVRSVVDAVSVGNSTCAPDVWEEEAVADLVVVCPLGQAGEQRPINAVKAAGGDGVILTGDGSPLTEANADAFPTAWVTPADGDAVRSWLSANPGSTVDSTDGAASVTGNALALAPFSSWGKPWIPAVSKPDIVAPGVNVLAATSPQRSDGPTGPLFRFMSGTSMATPHAAGAAAVVLQAHPDWTPGRVQSALMTTAGGGVLMPDAQSPTNAFHRGSGLLAVDRALDPGMIFEETAAAYWALRKTPWKANYPSLFIRGLGTGTTATRTLRSALPHDATWQITQTSTASITIDAPSQITIPAGGTADIDITITPAGLATGEVAFAELSFSDGTGRSARFPITVVGGPPDSNHTPVAQSQQVTTPAGTPVDITLRGHDLDIDDGFDWTIASQPSRGALTGTPPHMTYTPEADFEGSDFFTFTVDDGAATSPAGTISINVETPDTTPPAAVTQLTAHGGQRSMQLSWVPPHDAAGVHIRLLAGTAAAGSPTDGTLVYDGPSTDVTVDGLRPGATNTVTVFPYDAAGNFGPATPITVDGADLSRAASPTVATSGTETVISGTLTNARTGDPLGGEDVILKMCKEPCTQWVDVASGTTSATGDVALRHTLTRNSQYTLRYAGGETTARGSRPVSIGVRPRLTAGFNESVITGGERARISGYVKPRMARRTLILQRRVDGAWKPIRKITTSRTTYGFSVRPARGRHAYRVHVPGSVRFLKVTGPRNILRVR